VNTNRLDSRLRGNDGWVHYKAVREKGKDVTENFHWTATRSNKSGSKKMTSWRSWGTGWA